MKKNIIIIIAVLILSAAALYSVNNYSNRKVAEKPGLEAKDGTNTQRFSGDIGKASAIDFTLKDVNGNEVSLKDLRGKKVFLNFWATWCPPCRGEMPDIEKLYDEAKSSDLVILAVNMGEDRDTVKSFLDKNNYHFTVLLDENQKVSQSYNISAIPTSYFINADGKIGAQKTGAMELSEMKQYIENLK